MLKNLFKGKNILISSGATFEKIDDARAITNLSSGKMGLSIADEAYALGAKVTLIYGRTEKVPPSGLNCIYAPSHSLMNKYIKENAKNNDLRDAIVHMSLNVGINNFYNQNTNSSNSMIYTLT